MGDSIRKVLHYNLFFNFVRVFMWHTRIMNPNVTRIQIVKSVLLCIKVTNRPPKETSNDERKHPHGAIIPNEKRVAG